MPQRVIDDAYARDPAVAKAEYGCEWRDDLSSFISRELVEAAVDNGVTVRPPVRGVAYKAFADPSGGVHDSFTAAIAHKDGDVAVLDALIEIAAPFNPASTTAMVAATLKQYGCHVCVGDRYGAQWVVDAFAQNGIRYDHSEKDRSGIYLEALPLFSSGRVRLLENKRLVNQLCNLERRTSPAGRDRIDHPVNGADDASNAAAGALSLVSSAPTSLNVSRETAAAFGAAMADLGRRERAGQLRGYGRAHVTPMSWSN